MMILDRFDEGMPRIVGAGCRPGDTVGNSDRLARDVLPRLMTGRWFARLPDGLRVALVREARVLPISRGQNLFARGDVADGLYAVLDGAIQIGAVDVDGRPAVLTIVESPAWFGEIAVVDGLPRTHDATAVRDSAVLHVPHGAIVALLEREPAFWRELGRLLTEKLRLAFAVTEANVLLSASQRLAARLVMISEGYGGASAPHRDIDLSQDKLAELLSLSRQTVNRILKRFEAAGTIELRQGRINVVDADALRRIGRL